MEDKTQLVKDWIKEVWNGKPLNDHSILLRLDAEKKVLITLLDVVCCLPTIASGKTMDALAKEDIQALKHRINHQHD